MAMSFLKLDFLTLAVERMGVLKHVCTKHTHMPQIASPPSTQPQNHKGLNIINLL